jgi:hypothetical protein
MPKQASRLNRPQTKRAVRSPRGPTDPPPEKGRLPIIILRTASPGQSCSELRRSAEGPRVKAFWCSAKPHLARGPLRHRPVGCVPTGPARCGPSGLSPQRRQCGPPLGCFALRGVGVGRSIRSASFRSPPRVCTTTPGDHLPWVRGAQEEGIQRARTWRHLGHNKDRRTPQLSPSTPPAKTAVAIHFRAASGATDATRTSTPETLCELAGRRDFLSPTSWRRRISHLPARRSVHHRTTATHKRMGLPPFAAAKVS